MDRGDWPEPIRTLRGYLPAEVCVLRGALGALGGLAVLVGVFAVLLGGNWQLGYADDRVLASIFLALIPAAVGLGSPFWYWLGRPVWARLGRPGDRLARPLREVRFLPGLAGAVLGVALLGPVSATSPFWVQTLAPFGLAVALGAPLWFWVLRPVAGRRVEAWLPGRARGPSSAATGLRLLVPVAALFAASAVVTAAIALPVVGLGEPVSAGGLTVTVTDARTVTSLTEAGSETVHRGRGWRLLLVGVAVENRGDVRRQLPGTSVVDVAVLSPECSPQNFGEPSNNCNRVYVGENFSANGTTYANYDARREAAGGTVEPGDRVTGWLVFRIESPPERRPRFEAMVVVEGFGRWTLDGGWREGGSAS